MTGSTSTTTLDALGSIPVVVGASSVPPAPQLDAQLVQDTKQQIRALVGEIEALVAADLSIADFYAGFLDRVLAALAGIGGAIWTRDAQGALAIAYQANLPNERLKNEQASQRHAQLLEKVWLTSGQPQIVPPYAGAQEGSEAGNPTEHLLVIAPLLVEQQTVGLVEIFQRPGGGPTTQRGYLRFLVQMCTLAGDYLKNRRLAQYQEQQQLWDQFAAFLRAVHAKLDVRHTTFTLANEGRRLTSSDRLSVLLCSGRKARLTVVSGLDTIDHRAAEVRQMEQLATKVIAAGEPVWFAGDSSSLAPQIDDALHDFVDVSQARAVGIVPLYPPHNASAKQQRPRPIGALVVERWQQSRWSESARERVLAVADNGGIALANAQEYQSLFLLPLWKALGKAAWFARFKSLPKTLLLLALLVGIGAALVLIPRDLQLAARGKLQPALRRDIFVRTDGVVVEVPVDHAQLVEAGQVLAELRNTDLEVEIAALLGRKTTATEGLATAQRALLRESQLSTEEQNRIAGQILELKQELENVDQQLALYQQKQEHLVVRSDRFGQVVTWQVRDLLLGRPVQRGQVLMTLVDPRGDWELELLLPEKRLGHALAAQQAAIAQQKPLHVTFQLSTHPGREFAGRVTEIHRRAETHGEDGNMVLVRVAIDKAKLPELHSETTVTAKLHCGERPLGYVLFQDAIETVQSKVMFWF